MSLAQLCIKTNQRQLLFNRRSIAQIRAGDAPSLQPDMAGESIESLERKNSNLLLANVMLRSICRNRAGGSDDTR
jgi:hypothetical protein